MPPNIVLRPAREADLPAVHALDRQLFAVDAQWDETMDLGWTDSLDGQDFFRERCHGRDGILLVAEDAGAVIGFLAAGLLPAAVYRRVRQVAELECMYVLPAYRGQGVGRGLVAEYLGWAAASGAPRARVEVTAQNREATRFYEREGFAPFNLILEQPLG